MTENDDDLLRRLRQGDEEARRAFWDRFYPFVYRHVVSAKARGENAQDAEDIAQDTFVRAYKSVVKFEGRSSLKTWLITLSHNAAVDYYRASHYRVEDVGHDEAVKAGEAAARWVTDTSAPAEPLHHCLQQEERDLCRRLLAQLNEEQRAVVTSRLIDDLSTADTAALLGKSEGAVKMLLLRALQNLAGKWAELDLARRTEVATDGP